MRRVLCDLLLTLALVDRQLWPSILITIGCLVGYWWSLAFGVGEPWWGCMVYHLDHANVFHLALNLWGLYQFRPRWGTCAVAYVSSSLAALLPWCSMGVPTCGLSGFLMAAYARSYAERRLPIWKPLVANMVFVLFPMFNWKIHMVSFLIAYIVWLLKRK